MGATFFRSVGRLVATALLAVTAAAAAPPDEIAADYERLKEWRFAVRPLPLPAGGLEIRRDTTTFTLESGTLRLQEPTGEGRVTGLVFEGAGTFRMTIPDPHELAQLRRFAFDPELEAIEETFGDLVLRTSDERLFAGLEAAAGGGYKRHKIAADRHDHWLRIHQRDADAAVLAAIANRDEEYLRVDVKTKERGWMTWEYDSRRPEEIHLARFNPKYSFLEHWVALDDPADRDAGGRPGPRETSAIDIRHVEVDVSLLRLGKDPGLSDTSRHTLEADLVAEMTLAATRPGIAALELYLHPWAKIESITRAGQPLPFLRDHIGARSGVIDNRTWDFSFVVPLGEPLVVGEPLELAFTYTLDFSNYAPGRLWYPGAEHPDAGVSDLHTAALSVTTRDEYEVRAMGEPVVELGAAPAEKGLETSRWAITRPAKMTTFSIARKVVEETIALPDLPEIVVFSPPIGQATEARLHDIGVDVAQSLNFYTNLLAAPLEGERLYATMIQAFHGQSFDGFLHLSEFSAYRDRTGPTEVFLAHEVAHQWWGHLVGWASYRDQWLSEGLSEYSALLYLEATHPKGEKLFLDALAAYTNEVLGSLRSAESPFARPGTAFRNRNAARRIGPIGHGLRAATGEAPGAFGSLGYHKAALVLHSLRVLMRHTAAGEQAFVDILRDFVATHRGGQPTTDDFAAVVSRHAPGDWGWFFDQWIYRAQVPTWEWKARVAGAPNGDGGWPVELTVEQRDVPDDFRMLVPVRAQHAGGATSEKLIEIRGPETVATVVFAERPKKVIFNPDYSVLAKMKRR